MSSQAAMPVAAVGRVLVIGYGNVLRTDDGVGWHIAEAVAADPRLTGVDVLRVQQLTPDLACDLSEADLAILVDADHGADPGTWRVVDAPDPGATGQTDTGAWSHHVAPGTLLGLARELYGHAPRLVIVGVGVASLDVGEGLTPALRSAVPGVARAVADLILGGSPGMAGATRVPQAGATRAPQEAADA